MNTLAITDRIDLNAGYTCNMRCRFCYYQEQLKTPTDLTTDQAKYWMRYFYAHGKRAIDITGGEPTIRHDIQELVRYARDIGYESICVITNGIRMADAAFTRELVANGLNDALFSLHGPTLEVHESLTQSPGSFNKIMCAIANARSHGIRLRSNTVVNGISLKHIPETARMLVDSGVCVLNFIMFNPIIDAHSSDAAMNVSYAEAADVLKNIIDRFKDHVKKITVRYMPFCCMPGYEKYIVNLPQVQYDPDEWDYYLRTIFRNGRFLTWGAMAVGALMYPSWRWLSAQDRHTVVHELLMAGITMRNKVKGSPCAACSHRKICDGLWRDYARKKGFGELVPMKGDIIENPVFFIRDNPQFFKE